MTKLNFRSLIILELVLILVLSMIVAFAFLGFELHSELNRQFSRQHILVQQAFLDHKNELLNGADDGFKDALVRIANTQDVREFKFLNSVNSATAKVTRDLSDHSKNIDDSKCQSSISRLMRPSSEFCFSSKFYWDQSTSDVLIEIQWWPTIVFGTDAYKTSFLTLFSILLVGSIVCVFHWLLFRKVILDPVEDLIFRFDQFVRTGNLTAATAANSISSSEVSKLVLKFDHLVRVSKDLQASREQSARLEAAEEITKQVVHDLKSPLMALKFAYDLSANGNTDEIRALSGKALTRLTEILSTITTAKNLKSRGANTPPDDQTVTEVCSTISSIICESRLRSENAGIPIVFEQNGVTSAFAAADSVTLKRILSNLLSNSFESIDHSRGQIEVHLCTDEKNIEIAVVDNGMGIPASIVNRIGERGFSYGKETLKDAGSGFGVNHAKKQISAMGGSVHIESTERSGTIVLIKLPAAQRASL